MNKHFSSRLLWAIRRLGLKPTQFAHKAGVPQGTISKCLKGHVPTAKLLLRISQTTGKSIDWLLTGKEEKESEDRYVAEKPASYGRHGVGRKTEDDEVWIAKLLKVLRGRDARKKQTVKDLLDVLSR